MLPMGGGFFGDKLFAFDFLIILIGIWGIWNFQNISIP